MNNPKNLILTDRKKTPDEDLYLLHDSELKLMFTESDKERTDCLTYIAKGFDFINENNLEVNSIDFYIHIFLANPQILSDPRFDDSKFMDQIVKIQFALVYLYYEYEIPDFFMLNSTEYILIISLSHSKKKRNTQNKKKLYLK